MTRTVAHIALLTSAVSTGLFAGLLWTFAVGVNPMAATLDGPTYARVWQTLIGTIDRGIWPVLLLATLGPIVTLVAMRRSYRSRVFGLTLLGFLLFAFGVMVFTVTLNVPINNYVLSWTTDAPPADWMAARDRWDMLNSIRTPIAIIAFICYLLALASPLPVFAAQAAEPRRSTAEQRVPS
jgi:uncharacterized membrane protein